MYNSITVESWHNTRCSDNVSVSETESLNRDKLEQYQLIKFRNMLSSVLATNLFYRQKLNKVGLRHPAEIQTLTDYQQIPFTTKDQLSADQSAHPPYGTNLTFSPSEYIRVHQTSGTTGTPLRWLDDTESWNWWGRCWTSVYHAAGVTSEDQIFFAFSFGPFIGFWSAHEGARQIEALSIPGGGMSSLQRVQAICSNKITVLVCTPTYALHLGEVAQSEGISIVDSDVRVTIHAGEPGASLPATKKQIETIWGAQCYDHTGATEVGAWGFECEAQSGVHLNEGEFICEIIDPETGNPAEEGELVITNLGRIGMPIIRYRSGDQVKFKTGACSCGRQFRRLDSGIVGRIDDILIVRGVNIYPSAIENVLRGFPEIIEFAVDVYRPGALDEIEIRVEVNRSQDSANQIVEAVKNAFRQNFGVRADVKVVELGQLPRFELKSRRFTDRRTN
ncbi:TPA: phenylacetate--CoA ligase family protein [Candidatus Poribacteria bacterium]|nr:phenylacetate--CoA ligase family protein [Candidatus Poribacteria bacterium]HIA65696.1 phenylacetate--CoA ligase family protein [Candidatus Poribacteria bacterium]HIB86325.1 phenylacetate--CoA ligase family protein [Candidatus Poribacteria bacterium]HIB99890.1 phenylacetate--CoA ligase family protein [Candidatus Poribacteria bacterium]HIC17695.1 phenylacetate--CoA ligase family protein [Candidatus Poribacteria bacterium]